LNIATICAVRAILAARGVREAARVEGRPAATVSAALSRFEAAVAVPLVCRDSSGLTLTLEAERRFEAINRIADASRQLMNLADASSNRPIAPISILGLIRFMEVARSNSIRRAAKNLGVGQPQLTRQISDIERHLGFALLRRNGTGVSCSPCGQAALPIAEQIIQDWDVVSQAATERFRQRVATWRLGTVMPLGHESSIAHMLAAVAAGWEKLRPRQHLAISNTTADELLSGLKARRFDVVLIDHLTVPPEFECHSVKTDALWLVGPPGLDEDDDIASVIGSRILVLPSQRAGIRQAADQYLRQVIATGTYVPKRIVEVDSVPVIVNMVVRHNCLSVLPQSAVERLPHRLSKWPLPDNYRQQLTLVWHVGVLPKSLVKGILGLMHDVDYPPPTEDSNFHS
jgi:LysR family transcriptional regulator, nitrogen assimilation regulatory protein